MGIRDGGCTAQGCDAPPAMCPFHHRRIHDPGYEVDIGADNQVSFHRRT